MEIKQERIPTAYFWENYRITDNTQTGELFQEIYKDISVGYLNDVEFYLVDFAENVIKDKNIIKIILAMSIYNNRANTHIIQRLKYLMKKWDLHFLADPAFYKSFPKDINIHTWEIEVIPILKHLFSKKEGEMRFRRKSITKRSKSGGNKSNKKKRSKSGGNKSNKKKRSKSRGNKSNKKKRSKSGGNKSNKKKRSKSGGNK